jgi:hypothetical protein
MAHEHKDTVTARYSDLRVLQSAAGYYLGTIYQEFDANDTVVYQEPGSRDSGYFKTKEDAEAFLTGEAS